MATVGSPGAGVRAIVVYKTLKSAAELALVLVAVALWPFGLPGLLHQLAFELQRHVSSGWALTLASWLAQSATKRGVELSLIALGADGLLTGVEAWALRRGRWWGPWLVVVATGALLPLDVLELSRRPSASRLLLLAANGAIVAFLVHHARRDGVEHRAKISAAGRSASGRANLPPSRLD